VSWPVGTTELFDEGLAPDYVAPIVAFRTWRVSSAGELYSVHFPYRWTGFEAFGASCRAGFNHDAPDARCSCGVYALRAAEEALAYATSSGASVLGAVHLWGRLVPAERGFRAERAYPERLVIPRALWDHRGAPASSVDAAARSLSARYGVPCRVVTSHGQAAGALVSPLAPDEHVAELADLPLGVVPEHLACDRALAPPRRRQPATGLSRLLGGSALGRLGLRRRRGGR
jgi:hypothetical protein